jgi:hypothetical protein
MAGTVMGTVGVVASVVAGVVTVAELAPAATGFADIVEEVAQPPAAPRTSAAASAVALVRRVLFMAWFPIRDAMRSTGCLYPAGRRGNCRWLPDSIAGR